MILHKYTHICLASVLVNHRTLFPGLSTQKMQQITAPEILWRIFTLVESNADLARASRLNKFIGAAALDVLWNDIYFSSFLSLFPTHNTPGLFVGTTVWLIKVT